MNGKRYVSSECLLNVICNLFEYNTPLSLDEKCFCFRVPSVSSSSDKAAGADNTIIALLLLIVDLLRAFIARLGVTMYMIFRRFTTIIKAWMDFNAARTPRRRL